MTSDSLEAALVRVLLAELSIEQYRAEEVTSVLAAAVRKWGKKAIPERWNEKNNKTGWTGGYNAALADAARRLGL